jgi:hypothetical protein
VPPVRLRGPLGMPAGPRAAGLLDVTVGDARAAVSVTESLRKSKRSLAVRAPQGTWELWRHDAWSSRLLRDGRVVALLSRPRPNRRNDGGPLRPLAEVRYEAAADLLDGVMAHFFAVAFGLGDGTGAIRFGSHRPQQQQDPSNPVAWGMPWYTGVGYSSHDSGPGAGGDGWGGGDGGGGGGGGDSGGGGGGGGDGGGGGGGGGS